ncbi:patatin-like phospholipase family protein [Flavobacterium ajazii]|uniref:patatin-like phospholipase family protein n=1 Tax=Flavobacterium ajazii TaxID=2692318 RepID=UPI0013D32714|nr:patatin-like phospholipase family protein [Flavobacterium ajazii]
MAKIEFKELEHIALEGGGAKGVVYLGAIEALEEKMEEIWRKGEVLKMIEEITPHLSPIHKKVKYNSLYNDLKKINRPSILNYFDINGQQQTKIKSIAGSSAGAITALALTLGLNSSDIEKVLNYPFTNFLEEKAVGKYRMIDNLGNLKIAQDHYKKVGGGEKQQEKFEYQFNRYAKVNGEIPKLILRQTLVGTILETIFSGVIHKIDAIQKTISQDNFRDFIQLPLPGPGWIDRRFGYIKSIGVYKFLQILFTEGLFRKTFRKPLKLEIDTICNLIWDRGMFAGFSVREFFFDLIIYAATRDTHFQRGLLEKKLFTKTEIDDINKAYKHFEIGKRPDAKLGHERYFKYLQSLTFDDFYKITNINLGFNVTNMTHGTSLLFSHKHTPNFLLLEAAAASMTIPPAIKPLYTELDVFEFNKEKIPEKIIQGKNFDMDMYQIHEFAVKKYISVKNKAGIHIDTNNSINNSGYLNLMREVFNYQNFKDEEITVDEKNIIPVTKDLIKYYYNSAYKGMLVDGGTVNNIPYSFFREENLVNEMPLPPKIKNDISSMQGVLALKLDGLFPPEIYIAFNEAMDKILKEDAEKKDTEKKDTEKKINRKVLKRSYNDHWMDIDGTRQRKINTKIESEAKRILSINKINIKEYGTFQDIIFKLLKSYAAEKSIPPWKKQVSILSLVGTLQHNLSETNQIKYLSDHNHIIPLYSYGIDTYDFELNKFTNLINLSNRKAKTAVLKYFDT